MPNQYIFDDSGPTTYEFRDVTAPLRGHAKSRSRGSNSYGGGSTNGDDDGTGSLTYSAASSITGESTDSSFAGIKKVLEMHGETSKDLATYVKKQHYRTGGTDESCAGGDSLAYSAKSATSDSLAYSLDAESYMRSLAADGEASYRSRLQGTALLSNGQQSSQSGYDGGSYASAMGASYLNNGGGQRHEIGDDGNLFMMFSPAEHTDSMKRRKEKKRRERQREQSNNSRPVVSQNNASMSGYTGSSNSTSNGQAAFSLDAAAASTARERDMSNTAVAPTTPTRASRQTNYEGPNAARIVSPTFWPEDDMHTDNQHQHGGSYDKRNRSTGTSPKSSPSRTNNAKREPSSSPQRPPLHRNSGAQYDDAIPDDDNDVWYAKWWTLCFPDALQSLDPKR